MSGKNEIIMEFSSNSENESLARTVISAFVARLDPTLEELADIKTAVSEAVTNSIVHGYEDKTGIVKIVSIILIWIFGIIMITLYAPADTENVPILQKKVRKEIKIKSYISILFISALSIIIKDNTISNICIVGMLIQSINISKFAYSIFKLKFGYLEYIKNEKNAI